jgi:hypothetical protein
MDAALTREVEDDDDNGVGRACLKVPGGENEFASQVYISWPRKQSYNYIELEEVGD